MLVDGIIVEDRVNELSRRHCGVDPVQEAREFPKAMTRHTLPDNRAVENVERRRQQGGRAILMCHASLCRRTRALHRQAELGAVEHPCPCQG